MRKILLTGGHLSPAIAVIDEIGSRAELIFVGRKYLSDNEKTISAEYLEISKRRIKFYNLQTGRFTRLANLKFILNLLKIPVGLIQALNILLKEKPDVILSFGGYIGFPINISGFILKIPVIIHEQTAKPGLTNNIAGYFAKQIFVSFAETKKYFPAGKTIISGNPVRKIVLQIDKVLFKFQKTRPVLYVTGGSLGSHSINQKIEEILPDLLSKYTLIQQTGKVSEYKDFQRLSEIRKKMTQKQKDNYFIREHFFAEELGFIYSVADLIIGRSGANTFFELIAWKKPAIFIPLPWSANQEQLKQAQIFQRFGFGEIFEQHANSTNLSRLIDKCLANIDDYKNNFKKVKLPYTENAAKIISQTLLSPFAHKL